MSKKVAVGMSGGVDSSVSAYLLKEQGYDVTGVFIEAYNEPGCRTDQDKKDALKVALQLGIPFQSIDVRTQYKEKVVNYYLESYRRGATPNPDVVCNREVKFGLFYEWAMQNEFDCVATGHYARIKEVTEPTRNPETLYLQRATDLKKDQSYFLWQVNPAHLPHIVFPLGEMSKSEVRVIAHQKGFVNADKPDSMGVCMMGEFNTRQFLLNKLGERPGDVVLDGHSVGAHKGLWFHTIGQRGGFDIDKKLLKQLGYTPETMEPLYVIGKDVSRNQIIVGEKDKAQRNSFGIVNYELRTVQEEIHTLATMGTLYVRIRNLGELEKVSEVAIMNHALQIKTYTNIFGVAEGQAAVLYARQDKEGDEVVIGGGEIGISFS